MDVIIEKWGVEGNVKTGGFPRKLVKICDFQSSPYKLKGLDARKFPIRRRIKGQQD